MNLRQLRQGTACVVAAYRQFVRRFAQGNGMDRARPHFLHRDYWALRHVGKAVEGFAASLDRGCVLDFGSGEAPYAALFAARGIELQRADIAPSDEQVLPIDAANHTPLDDTSVDAVISTQVLEHVSDVNGYLNEARRVLKPGGRLLLTTHGAFILHRQPTDYRRWTVDGLRLELELAGFEIDRIEPKIGILATSTHFRSIVFGSLMRRIPGIAWMRPMLYGLCNLRMAIEEKITPQSAMEAQPELLIALARKP